MQFVNSIFLVAMINWGDSQTTKIRKTIGPGGDKFYQIFSYVFKCFKDKK